MADDNKNIQELTAEELNDVAAGRALPSSDSRNNLASLAGKCSRHPDGAYRGYHSFISLGKERCFGIFETYDYKCEYCGTTKSDWELSLGVLGGRY